jgi:hypothetical protein
MSGKSGEAFLQSIADFFVASGMREQCFSFGALASWRLMPLASMHPWPILCAI